jgi:hypothetical protein
MDTVRIGFFLEELYGLSCCACDIGNASSNGEREKVYITAGPEFGLFIYLMIEKYLYASKTSAARFHEYSSDSLLGIELKKTKNESDLCMLNISSNYEFLFGARILRQS